MADIIIKEPLPKLDDFENIYSKDLKYDQGKSQLGLVHTGLSIPIQELGKILTFGAEKYKANSWQDLENGVDRYTHALYRHLNTHHRGELRDPETGELHISHALCNLAFLTYFQVKELESQATS